MSLKQKIKSGKFAVFGEFEPPKGSDFTPLNESAMPIRGRVDAIIVPEMANAVLKASSLGACAYLQNKGIEAVFQVCCRDRNRLALQADILSAAALGIPNIMAIEGEEIKFGDHPQARTVNDLDLTEILQIIAKIQNGKDMAGIELRGSPDFCVGSTVDTAVSGGLLDIELENLKKRVELGVEYFITNPIFDIRRLQQFTKRVDMSRVRVIPKVLLLKSAGMARYIDQNVKGISIPSEMIREIQKAPDKVKECIRIACDLIIRLREMGMPGVLISTLGWEKYLPQILDEARL